MANIYVAATATWNGNALKKGKKEISSFEKSVKSLGRTLGLTLGSAALINYGKNAVKAFAADEKAAKALEVQLKNTGFAFSAPGVELYIANLQKATGVLDDQLRPALQTLLTASGSLTQSQKALAVALDVSAATGKSVTEVSAAMAKGFSGQTTALTRLGAGLSKATLASGDMNKILDELNMKFSGQASARLDTYAGKMDQFKVASANASETIGKGILTALSQIGKDKNLDTATKAMDDFATSISNVTIGLGVMIGKLTSIAQNSGLTKILGFLVESSIPGMIAKLGARSAADLAAPKSNFTYSLGSGAATEIAAQKEAAAIKAAAKARAEELRLLKQKNAIENKNVEELKKKFDLERIGLTAALNNSTDEETKLRIRAQLAILDNNEALAKKYLAEMEAAEALKKLAMAADDVTAVFARLKVWNPLSGLKPTAEDLMKTGVSSGTNTNSFTPPALTYYNPLTSLTPTPGDISSAGAYNPLSGLRPTAQDIQIYIDATNMIDSDRMVDVVQNAFLTIQRQGGSTVPAGAF